MNRFQMARICIDGASNPRRVAQALVDAIDEARKEGADDVTIKDDIGVILILDQLMYLLGSYHGSGVDRHMKAVVALELREAAGAQS